VRCVLHCTDKTVLIFTVRRAQSFVTEQACDALVAPIPTPFATLVPASMLNFLLTLSGHSHASWLPMSPLYSRQHWSLLKRLQPQRQKSSCQRPLDVPSPHSVRAWEWLRRSATMPQRCPRGGATAWSERFFFTAKLLNCRSSFGKVPFCVFQYGSFLGLF